MKAKLDTLFRAFVMVLLLTLAWSVWAGAQAETNKPAVTTTNQPSGMGKGVEHFQQHYLTFGLDRVGLLQEFTLLGEPFWKYLASLIYILMAFYVSKVIDLITLVWLKRLAARTETKLDDLLLDLLHGPIKVVAFVLLLNVGLNVFDWSERAKSYLSKALIVVVAASLTYLVIKIIDVVLDAWKQRSAQEADRRLNDQLFSVVHVSLNTFVIIVAVLVTAQNLDIRITAAIASLSIGGLAVGLAAQDTLGNLFGAVAVLVDKPFQVGDQIKLDGAEGTVEAVGLRSTRVRNPDGCLVAVPNKTMGNAIITNLTRRPSIKTVMNLGLARTLPAEKVKRALAILDDIYRAHPMTEKVWVSFSQFAPGNLNVTVVYWLRGTDYQSYLAGMQEMNLKVKERFDVEGISLA